MAGWPKFPLAMKAKNGYREHMAPAPKSPPVYSGNCPPEKRKFVLIAAILASAMGFIDGSVVAIAVPKLRDSLDASFVQVQWVTAGYFLFMAAPMLVAGAAGDRYGIKRVFGIGIGLFVFASLSCTIAWSAEALIFFRCLQGIGASIMVPGSMAIISRNYPREERGAALGTWVASSSITTVCGPLIGGILLSQGGVEAWRLIFAINLPLGGIALLLLWLKVPDDEPRERVPVDLVGAFLAIVGMGALALGLSLIGETREFWLGLIAILSGLAVLAFTMEWWLSARHPMIDLDLFRSKAFAGANLMTFAVWAGLGAVLFYLPMVLVIGWSMNELVAAGTLLPFGLTIASMSRFTGKLADRYGARMFLSVGPAVSACGYLWLALGLWQENYWLGIIPAVALLGVSLGLMASPLSAAVMSAVDDDKAGQASGINNVVARFSNLLGIAGLGALASTAYASFVRGSGLDPAVSNLMVQAGFGERLTGALYQVTTQQIQFEGMNHALAVTCIVATISCVVGGLVGWLTQERRRKKRA